MAIIDELRELPEYEGLDDKAIVEGVRSVYRPESDPRDFAQHLGYDNPIEFEGQNDYIGEGGKGYFGKKFDAIKQRLMFGNLGVLKSKDDENKEAQIAKMDKTTKAGSRGFVSVFKEKTPFSYIPFVSSIEKIDDMVSVYQAANRKKAGSASEIDDRLLESYAKYTDIKTTDRGSIADIITGMPSFMGEFALTFGVTNRMAERAIGGALKGAVKTLVKGAVAGTAQTALIPTRISEGVAQRMVPGVSYDDVNEVYIQGGEKFIDALVDSVGDNWVEVLSERSGYGISKVLAPLNLLGKATILRLATGKATAKLNNTSMKVATKVFKKMGYDGIIPEVLEERVGEVGRAVIGIEDWKMPTWKQVGIELVAFAVPGTGLGIVNYGMSKMGVDTVVNAVIDKNSVDLSEEDVQMADKLKEAGATDEEVSGLLRMNESQKQILKEKIEAHGKIAQERTATSVSQLIDYLRGESSDIRYEITGMKTLQDQIDDENMPEVTEESAREAIKRDNVTYSSGEKKGQLIEPADAFVYGTNYVGTAEDALQHVIEIARGGDITTVVEEKSEDYVKRQSKKWQKNLKKLRKEYEKATGEKVDKEDIEWFSDKAVDYAVHNRIHEKTSFKLKEILSRYVEYAKEILKRAGALRKQIRQGKVSKALLQELDASVFGDKLTKKQIAQQKKTKSANPSDLGATHSIRTWNAKSQHRIRTIAKNTGVPEAEVDKWAKDLDTVSALIGENQVLDYDPNTRAVALKPNADYGTSLDFSTLCKKRTTLANTIDAIQLQVGRPLSETEMLETRSLLSDKGVVVSCGLCYVETRRRKTGKHIAAISEMFPEVDKKLFLSQEGFNEIQEMYPSVYKKLKSKLGGMGVFAKMPESRTEYKGEILDEYMGDRAKVNSKNVSGGQRMQSWSDFELVHMLDLMQAVVDMNLVGLKAFAYTKETNMVEAFGNTGIMFNMSLIPKGNGFDKDGKLSFDPVEGMPYEDAVRLRDKYSKTAGTVAVGISDDHIKALLADPTIDFVIPYHASGMSEKARKQADMNGWKDYTATRREKYTEGVYESGKKKGKDRVGNNLDKNDAIQFPDFLDSDGTVNMDRYFAHIKKNKWTARTPQFENEKGFHKLLTEWRAFDGEGNSIDSQPVQPVFNMEFINEELKNYKGEGGKPPVDVVKEMSNKFSKSAPTYQLRAVASKRFNEKAKSFSGLEKTDNVKSTGYILSDGTVLRKNLKPFNHPDIEAGFYEVPNATGDDVADFVANSGAIRNRFIGIEMFSKPTDAQRRVIGKRIREEGTPLHIDATSRTGKVVSKRISLMSELGELIDNVYDADKVFPESSYQLREGKGEIDRSTFDERLNKEIAEIKADAVKRVRDARKDTKASIRLVQDDLTSYIKALDLEAKDKAKFIGKIKLANTPRTLKTQIKKIEKRAIELKKAELTREYKKNISKELKGTKKARGAKKEKYDYEANSLFVDLRKFNNLTKEKATEEYDALSQKLDSSENKLGDKYDRIKLRFLEYKKDGADAQLAVLAEVYNDITLIKALGEAYTLEKEMRERLMRKEQRTNILHAFQSNKSQESAIGKMIGGLYSKTKANIYSLFSTISNLEIAKMMNLEEKEADRFTNVYENVFQMSDEAARALGINVNELKNKMDEMSEEKYVLTSRTGMETKLSTMELLHVYLGVLNEQMRNRYNYHFGLEGSAEQDIDGDIVPFLEDGVEMELQGEKVIVVSQIANLLNNLKAEEMAMADAIQEKVQEYYDKVNPVHIRQTGRSLKGVENYFPMKSEREVDFSEEVGVQGEFAGFQNERSAGSPKPVPTNIWDVATRHIADAEHVINVTEKYVELKNLLNSNQELEGIDGKITTIKKYLNDKYGDKVFKNINTLLDAVSLNHFNEQLDFTSAGYSKALSGWTVAKIAASPSVVGKQLISAVNYAENMDWVEWSKGFGKGLLHPVETYKYMFKNSPYLSARLKTGYNEQLNRITQDASKLSKANNDWALGLTFLTRYGDIGAIVFGGYPYLKHLREEKNMSPEKANALFVDSTVRSQQSGLNSSRSGFQLKNDMFSKTYNTFKNTPNQYFRKLIDAQFQLINGDITATQYAKTMMIYAVIQPALFGYVGSIFPYLLYHDDEDEGFMEYSSKNAFKYMMLSPLSSLMFISDISAAVYRRLTGKRVYQILSTPMLEDVEIALRGIIANGGITASDVIFAFSLIGEMASKLPILGVTRIGKGIAEKITE